MSRTTEKQKVADVRNAFAALPSRLADAQVFLEDALHGPNNYCRRFSVRVSDDGQAVLLSSSDRAEPICGKQGATRDRIVAALGDLPALSLNRTLMIEDPHKGPGEYTDDFVIVPSDDGGTTLIRSGKTHEDLTR